MTYYYLKSALKSVLGVAATFGIALMTTFQRAYSAANTNPAQVLRAE
ncbi:MAG: hypothetical protein WDZ76_13430 [Pseudohongiellaceae bacterium]